MTKKQMISPVKLKELRTLANEYKICLTIRSMDGYKEVHVTRGNLKEYQWRKLILRLKAAGFMLSAGEWFGVLKKGKWMVGPFKEDSIPA